jgi:hypothetical protein
MPTKKRWSVGFRIPVTIPTTSPSAPTRAAESKPVHVTWQFERNIALAEAEAWWCDETAQRIESGVSYGGDSLHSDRGAAQSG